MQIVKAKDAATMIATGKAKASDFTKVHPLGLYEVSDSVSQRVFGTSAKSAYEVVGHRDRKARFGA